jgi:vitamin B12 transporter
MRARLVFAILIVLAPSPAFARQTSAPVVMSGTVVDPTGIPLPRATVRLLDAGGIQRRSVLTDDAGVFTLDVSDCAGCRVEAQLTGFAAMGADVVPGRALEVVLPVEGVREHVLVSATRTDTPAVQTGATSTVVTAEHLANRQALAVSDVLRSVPAFTVVRTGGVGNLTSVYIRGGESNYTKVLLDGIPLNDPGGFFDFGSLSTDHVDRIEIVRGPQSALFGSDAMAGVIQLFTPVAPPGADPVDVVGGFEGGSFSTWHARAGLTGRAGPLGYFAEAARLETDNEQPNNAYEQSSFAANVGGSLSDRTDLRLVTRISSGEVGTPGQTAFGRPDLDAFGDRRDVFVGATARFRSRESRDQRFWYRFASSRQVSTNLVADPAYTPSFEGRTSPFEFFDFLYDSGNDIDRHHVGYQSDWRLGSIERAGGAHVLTASADWDHESGTLDDRLTPEPPVEASRDNFGVTVQDQVIWPRVFVTLSARAERNESYGGSFAPRAVVAYLARAEGSRLGATKLKASAGLGVKEPSLVQSFSPSPSFEGNPDLEPERARGFEAGIEQRACDGRLKLELNAFFNTYRDIIATETLSFSPFRAKFFNIGRTRAYGTELIVQASPALGVEAVGSYTWLDSEITDSTSEFSPVLAAGQPLFRRPRHSGSLSVSWSVAQLTLSTTGLFVGRRSDSDFSALEPPMVENEGYARWDLSGSYRLGRGVTFIGVVENLFDREYMEPLGYPALGLATRVGVRVIL